jgi:hypothetical protein
MIKRLGSKLGRPVVLLIAAGVLGGIGVWAIT